MSSTIGLIGPIYLIWVRLVWSKHYSGNCLPTLHGHQHGSFWWRDVLKLQQQFKGTSSITLANGATCFLWLDLWNETYPELFSFCKNTTITIQSAAHAPQFHDLFHLPLSPEAFAQYLQFYLVIQNLQLQPTNDSWTYIWDSSIFTANRAYKQLMGHQQVHQGYGWLWKSSCQNKRKFFFCLLLKDRLSTRALLKRNNMFLEDYNCVFAA